MTMCPYCDKVYDESEYSKCPYCSDDKQGKTLEFDNDEYEEFKKTHLD